LGCKYLLQLPEILPISVVLKGKLVVMGQIVTARERPAVCGSGGGTCLLSSPFLGMQDQSHYQWAVK
jgi:hypothetical protein